MNTTKLADVHTNLILTQVMKYWNKTPIQSRLYVPCANPSNLNQNTYTHVIQTKQQWMYTYKIDGTRAFLFFWNEPLPSIYYISRAGHVYQIWYMNSIQEVQSLYPQIPIEIFNGTLFDSEHITTNTHQIFAIFDCIAYNENILIKRKLKERLLIISWIHQLIFTCTHMSISTTQGTDNIYSNEHNIETTELTNR